MLKTTVNVMKGRLCNLYIPLAGMETFWGACSVELSTLSMNPHGVLCVALKVGPGDTGHCCIVHCVHHQRASLRLIVNSNMVDIHGHTLT